MEDVVTGRWLLVNLCTENLVYTSADLLSGKHQPIAESKVRFPQPVGESAGSCHRTAMTSLDEGPIHT